MMESDLDFLEAAKKWRALAKCEADAIGDVYIGAQHLLLAAIALSPLRRHGIEDITFERVQVACRKFQIPGMYVLSPGGRTPTFKLAVEVAWNRAKSESRPVELRDIWFGLLSDAESYAGEVLVDLGLNPDVLRQRLT